MDVRQMRLEILKAYPGKKWQDKVARMNDDQVIAVYHSFKDKEMRKAIMEREKELIKQVFKQADQVSMADVYPSAMPPFKK